MTTREAAENVVILNDRPDHPIFHRRGEGEFSRDLHRMVWWSVCGYPIGFWAGWIRRSHAEKFGWPCKRCFPGSGRQR